MWDVVNTAGSGGILYRVIICIVFMYWGSIMKHNTVIVVKIFNFPLIYFWDYFWEYGKMINKR